MSTLNLIYFQAFEHFPLLPETYFREKLTKELSVVQLMRKLAISEKAVDRHFAATMITSFTKVYSDIERERMRRITDQQLVTYPMACQYLKLFRELKEASIQNEEESTAKLQSCFSFLDGH